MMKRKKNIIQFLPYSKPHTGGVENVGEGIFLKWTYGKSFLISGCQQQKSYVHDGNRDKEKNKSPQRDKFIFPDFEIVDNFPTPKIWTILFWKQWKKMREEMKSMGEGEDIFVITHTRFFISSLMGGIFARKHKLTWIHVEHGSDYVKLSSSFKTKVAYIYDKILGRWIFKNADKILCISKASKDFIEKEFRIQEGETWFRGRDMPKVSEKDESEKLFLYIGRLVHLKGVDVLLRAYKELSTQTHLIIIGDGNGKEELIKLAEELGISQKTEFLGCMPEEKVLSFLSQKHCIVVNPSYQEGMPTTVIEGLMTKNVVVATDVGGTKEISNQADLLLVSPGNVSMLKEKLETAEKKYEEIQGKSYTHVRGKFSWDKSLEQLYDLLD